jgi:hypothetical protein
VVEPTGSEGFNFGLVNTRSDTNKLFFGKTTSWVCRLADFELVVVCLPKTLHRHLPVLNLFYYLDELLGNNIQLAAVEGELPSSFLY